MHNLKFPIGPQHPGVKEPIYLKVFAEGDTVTKAEFRGGYVHRGMEKLMEGQETITAMHSAEKICGICSYAHNSCLTNAIEGILRINPSLSVKMTRNVIGELERIHSHLMWLGFLFHDAGFDTLFMYYWREREKVLELFEKITGQRVHHAINFIGTTKINISESDKLWINKTLRGIKEKVNDYYKDLINNSVIKERFSGVGFISKDYASLYNTVGPTARASGIQWDTRLTGYSGFNELSFEAITSRDCDVYARTIVRIKEITESINIIEQALEKITKPAPAWKETWIKRGEGYARVEAPRGELFYYISVKKNHLLRVKVKTPTFNNFPVLLKILEGEKLSNIPLIVASIDPCISCMERLLLVKDGRSNILSKHEFLRRYCGHGH